MKHLLTALLVCGALAAAVPAQDPAPAAEPAPFLTTDGYPLDKCIVSDEALDEKAKVFEVDGHTFKTCCGKCKAKVEKAPAEWIAKKEAAVIAAQSARYPLETCVISGKALGSMGDPVNLVLDNTLVKLCCGGCKKRAIARSAELNAKVQQAAFAQQKAAYAPTVCPVSGHELDDEAVAVMHGTTLVKLCCEDCFTKLAKTPNAVAAKVAGGAGGDAGDTGGAKQDAAGKPKTDHAGDGGHGKAPETAAAAGGCCSAAAGSASGQAGCCAGGAPCCQEAAPAKAKVAAPAAKKVN